MSIVVQVDASTSGSTRREELIKSLTDVEDSKTIQSQTTKKIIQKVLVIMLQDTKDFGKYFVPRVVSFGPYHHGKDELRSAETLKLKFTKEFIDGKQEQMMKVYDNILEDIEKLREFYDEDPTNKYDDEALARMLFVDGCSVLYYIHCYVYGKLYDWMIKDRLVAFVNQDLFLLENQLPFQVLKMLMSAKYGTSEGHVLKGMETIELFIIVSILTPGKWEQPRLLPPQEEEHYDHLLDLLRKLLIGNTHKNATNFYEFRSNSFFSVTELTAVGIHFKPSKTNCLSDVSFKPHWITGHLKLPPMIVDNSTKPKFLNLIAYEMCPNVINDFEVTSYVCFLDLLINHSDDVKMLRAAQTLHNWIGSDEEVVKLFKEIAADLVPNPRVYEDVKGQIGRYLSARGKAKMASWLAEVSRDYFRSPWTTIAVLAGFIAISLSIVQTYFTIFPLPSSRKVQ